MRHVAAVVALSLTLAVGVGLSCATSTPAEVAIAHRAKLEELSTAMAVAGMSVPVPPRLCDEPIASHAVLFDDEVGCVSAPPGAQELDVLTVYARAIVARRVPEAPDARADALVRAFLDGKPEFLTMAAAIEAEFDAKRAAIARAPKPVGAPKARPKKDGVVDAGPVADAGPARGPPVVVTEERDAGVAGVVDAGNGAVGVRDRLIGTWATTKPSPIVHVHALCADGAWAVRFEATNEVGRMVVGDLRPIHGTWEVRDGEPPRITLTASDGERQEGTVPTLTDDAAVLAIEGDDPETIRVARRSKTATCD